MDNSLTRWRKPIVKIPFSRNSKSSVWKPNFFPRQAKERILFPLHFHYTGDTQCRVWFDLGNSLTRWKTIIFEILKNSQFARFAKFRMKTHFFPRQAIPTTFWLYTVITLVILNTEFGLIWATPWPDEKQFFFKFSKKRNSRNSRNSVWKLIFFRCKLYQQLWLYTFITMVILNTEFGLIWTTPWPDGKELFLKFSKIRNSRNSPNSVWITIFS